MKPAVTYPEPERASIDLLESMLGPHEPAVTVGVGVPAGWEPAGSPAHLQVTLDGTPVQDHPVGIHATIRVTVRARSTSEAKRVALLAHGLFTAHDGTPPITRVRPLVPMLPPGRDPKTQAELAGFTVRVTVRSQLIEPPGS